MKRFLAALAVAGLLSGCCGRHGVMGEGAAKNSNIGRQTEVLREWEFLKGDSREDVTAVMGAMGWTSVTVPHTWNNLDGEDGGNDYKKSACWYRREVDVHGAAGGRSFVLRFEGANRRTELFINGTLVGTHVGGFAAFAFDVTKFVHDGANELAVRVSNEKDTESPPLSADFTFDGGLYRPMELMAFPAVHLSALDMGSSGVRVRTSDITDASVTISVRALIENDLADAADSTVVVTVRDAMGKSVARSETPARARGGETVAVESLLTLKRPHRWNGVKDPYLYSVDVAVMRNGREVDHVTQPLGIRTFAIDKEKGFLLNGVLYHLHGVDRHQDRIDQGWAVSDAELDEDMAIIKELGCTAIRLAHYQHHGHFYDLCDRAGIIVWTEAPVVNDITPDAAFAENAKQQLRELIRQNCNHPSICFWSLGNEVGAKIGNPTKLFTEMNAVAHKEDSTRMTTLAFAGKGKEWPGITDTYGKNRYFGWYSGTFADLTKFLAGEGSEAISEYGAGASIYFHSEHPQRMDHTEEYQSLFHETYWPQLKAKQSIWGTYVWCLFDFAADQRKEGDHAGRNDKGLVTYDRKTRKDAFYYYKANWSEEPVVHINSSRFRVRGEREIAVKVYANLPEVELLVNGKSMGKKSGENCVFLWDKIELKEGENRIVARGLKDGKALEDSCVWTYRPGTPSEVYMAQDETMRKELEKGPPRPAKKAAATQTE